MRHGFLLSITVLLPGPLAAGQPEPVKVDHYGDPLPPGAVQRFGKSWCSAATDARALSPDGRSIICLRNGINLLRFDRQTGRLIESATLPTEPVPWAQLSADGRRAILYRSLYGDANDVWEVWDLDRAKLVSRIRPETGNLSRLVSFAPDGRHVAAGFDGCSAHDTLTFWVALWDADTGKRTGALEAEFPVDANGGGWGSEPHFSADGRRLLWYHGRRDQLCLAALDTRGHLLWQKVCPCRHMWSPVEIGGRLLLPGDPPGRLADWSDGEETSLRLPRDTKPDDVVGTVGDGKTLLYRAAAGGRFELRAWDLGRAAPDAGFDPVRLKTDARPYLWPTGRDQIAVAVGTGRLFDVQSRRFVGPHPSAAAHKSAVRAIGFSADATRLVSADDSNALKLWDLATGWVVGEWDGASSPVQWERNGSGGGNGSGGPTAFDLSSDGRRLVLAERRGDWQASKLRLIDTASGRTRATRALPEPENGQQLTVGRLEFDRSADRILVAFGDYQNQDQGEPTHKLVRWEVASNGWTEVGTLPMSSTARGARVGGRWFVGGRVFDARTGRPVVELVDAARWGFAVTPDGRLAAGLGRGTGRTDWPFFDPIRDLRVWDARTGDPLVHLSCPPLPPLPPVPDKNGQYSEDSRNQSRTSAVWPRALAFHPSGRLLATADVRGVRLWDLAAGRVMHTFPLPVRTSLESTYLGSPATSLAFTPDGSRLATGLPDGTILLWPVPIPTPNPPKADELAGLWADLMGSDSAKGWRAAWRLMDDSAAAVNLVRAHLKPAERVPAAEVAKLLADADAPEFRRREAATRRLEAIIDQVLSAVQDAEKAAGASAELRERLRKVLATAPGDDRPLPARAAAQGRVIAVLEHVRTAEATAVLRELAGGAPGAWLTHEAEAALARPTSAK